MTDQRIQDAYQGAYVGIALALTGTAIAALILVSLLLGWWT